MHAQFFTCSCYLYLIYVRRHACSFVPSLLLHPLLYSMYSNSLQHFPFAQVEAAMAFNRRLDKCVSVFAVCCFMLCSKQTLTCRDLWLHQNNRSNYFLSISHRPLALHCTSWAGGIAETWKTASSESKICPFSFLAVYNNLACLLIFQANVQVLGHT